MSHAMALPFTESRISFVRLCERHEAQLFEREIIPSLPGAAGLAVSGISRIARAAGAGLAWFARSVMDAIDTGRFPETALLDKLPAWQRDSQTLLDKLLDWQTKMDQELAPLGIRLQGVGIQIQPFEQLKPGYMTTAMRLLTPGMRGGGGNIIGGARKMLDDHRKFLMRMLKDMAKIGGRAAEAERLPEGVDIEELTAKVTESLDALDEVVNEIEANAAALADVPKDDTQGLQAAVAAVVTPLNQVIEVLEASQHDVQGIFDKLVTGIPAGLPAGGIFGRPQRRAANRYRRTAEPMLGAEPVAAAYPNLPR